MRLLRNAIPLCLTLIAATAGHCQETPVQADAFVDSVGINVHLGYTNTLYYNNFPLIESALSGLYIRHVRDDEPVAAATGFYANHSALLALGIHGEFATQITESSTDISSYPGLFAPGYFEAFEPPNECDVTSNCGSPWVSSLISFLGVLSSNSGSYPVFGPSFASPLGAPAVGDVSAYTSFGNLHDYKGGWNPEFAGSYGFGYTNYLSTALNISLASITNPNQPFVITETGYTNALHSEAKQTGYPAGVSLPADPNAISESDATIYMPRLLLNGWLSGAKRTYLYELLSSPGQDYGLLRGDGTRKPAYNAIYHLLALLADPGPSFQVTPLTYTLSGGDSALQHLLLQKRHGTYFLALWLNPSIYNKFTNVETPVIPETVTLTTGCGMKAARVFSWLNTGSVVATDVTPGKLTLSIGSGLTVVQLTMNN